MWGLRYRGRRAVEPRGGGRHAWYWLSTFFETIRLLTSAMLEDLYFLYMNARMFANQLCSVVRTIEQGHK